MKILRDILSFFRSAGDAEVWLVGGAVRDMILGAESITDLDLAVSVDPAKIAESYSEKKKSGFVLLDEEHGLSLIHI